MDRRCLMPAFEAADLVFRQQAGGLMPKIIHLESQTLVGWMNLMGPDAADAEHFSALFKQSLAAEPNLMGGKDLWQVHMLPVSQAQRELVFTGVTAEGQQLPAERYVNKFLPGGDHLFLPLNHPNQDRTPGERFLFHTFLPGSGLRVNEPLVILRTGENPGLFLPVVQAE